MANAQEALRLSEEAFMKIADLRNLGKIQPEVIAFETLYTIREALQKQKNDPVCSVCCKPHDKDNPVGYFLPPANELDSWEQLVACDDPTAVPLYAAPQPVQQAEQEPVAWAYCPECGSFDVRYEKGRYKQCANCFQEWFSDLDYSDVVQQNLNRLYAAPVRTKDLTDDEILSIPYLGTGELKTSMVNFARAVIAADREKNK